MHHSKAQVFYKQYECKTILFNLTIFVSLSVAAEKNIKYEQMRWSKFRCFMHNFDNE